MTLDKRIIGMMAELRPDMLNVHVALHVMGWREVILAVPMHGRDQVGQARLLPNYALTWGINRCVHYLLLAEKIGKPFIEAWAEEV